MKPMHHVGISAVVSVGFWHVTQSWLATFLCFLSGVLIDVDHHLDCYLGSGKFPFRYKDLVTFCESDQHSKFYLFFHSYELLLLLWLLISVFQLGPVWMGVLLGATVHLICDDIVNPMKPVSYFFSYRLYHKFERQKLLKQWKKDEIA